MVQFYPNQGYSGMTFVLNVSLGMEFYSYLVIYLNGEVIHLPVPQPKLQISTSKRCSQTRVLSLACSLSHNHALSHATLAPMLLDGITVCFEDPTQRLGDSWVDLLGGGVLFSVGFLFLCSFC